MTRPQPGQIVWTAGRRTGKTARLDALEVDAEAAGIPVTHVGHNGYIPRHRKPYDPAADARTLTVIRGQATTEHYLVTTYRPRHRANDVRTTR